MDVNRLLVSNHVREDGIESDSGVSCDESSSNGYQNPLSRHYFDTKLQPTSIPEWDGNTSTLVRWLKKMDDLGRRSRIVFKQLGEIVPTRFTGAAENWFYSLPTEYRAQCTRDWDSLRSAIAKYWMNGKWLAKIGVKARKAFYRDELEQEPGNGEETPSEYYIRKTELLASAFPVMCHSKLVEEVMNGAPEYWRNVLNKQDGYGDVVEFQNAIRYHEDTLLRMDRMEKGILGRWERGKSL